MNAVTKLFVKFAVKRKMKALGIDKGQRRILMTAGLRSSEFWMSIIAVVLKWLGPHLGLDFPNEAVGIVASYVVGRSLAKFGKASVPAV